MIYFLAKNYQDFRYYLDRTLEIDKQKIKYADSVWTLHGVDLSTSLHWYDTIWFLDEDKNHVVFCDGWYSRSDEKELQEYLKTQPEV